MFEKEYLNKLINKEYASLGWYFWNAFCTLPMKSAKRKLAVLRYNSLTRNQKRRVESV